MISVNAEIQINVNKEIRFSVFTEAFEIIFLIISENTDFRIY